MQGHRVLAIDNRVATLLRLGELLTLAQAVSGWGCLCSISFHSAVLTLDPCDQGAFLEASLLGAQAPEEVPVSAPPPPPSQEA